MSNGELLYAQQQQYALQQQAAQQQAVQAASQELAPPGAGEGILQNQQQQALVALSQQHAHAQAVAHAQQERAAAAAAAFGTALQQYPSSVPSTPLSHASPRSSPVKATPDSSVGASAGPGADAGRPISNPVQASSPFSNGVGGSVISPSGSTFSSGANEQAMAMAAEAATYGRATGMALAGATGMGGSPVKGAMLVQPQSLGGMDLDPNSFGNGSITPGASSSGASFMYPPPIAGSSAHPNVQPPPTHAAPSHPAPSMSSAPRHHPYAHASRPTLHTQVSASSFPLYLSSPSPVGGPGATTPPPYPSQDGTNNLSLGVPSTATSVAPQRVHSAPAHILTLSTQNLDQLNSPIASAEPDSQGALDQRRFLAGDANPSLAPPAAGSAGLHDSASDTTLHLSTASAPSTTPAPIPLQPQQPVTPVTAFQGNRPAAMRIDTSANASNVLSTLSAPQSAPPTAMEDTRMSHVGYNEKVSAAISLLQKRLPIMGAALSTSETESGQDEEEIWKGIEGAYDELKRIMVGRKDGRRRASLGASAKRNFTTMELESPITPITPNDHLGHAYTSTLGGSSAGGAGAAHSQMAAPPPLIHSLSMPDVNLAGSSAAARQAAYVQAQAVQLQQHAQLQHAHMQAQANAEVEHRIKVEEEARQQHAEAETRARAEAAAEAEAMAQHQRAEQAMREAEQYQQALVHEEQLRLARERLHQQMQEGAAPGAPQVLPNPPAPPPTPSPAASATMSQSSQPSPPSQQTSSTELTPQPPAPQQLAPIGFGGSASTYGQVAPQMMPMASGPLLAIPTQIAPGAISPPLFSAGGSQSSSAGASTYQFTGGVDPASDQMAMQMHLTNLATFQQQQAQQHQQQQQAQQHQQQQIQQQAQQQQQQQQQAQQQQQQQHGSGHQQLDSVDPSLTGGIAPSAMSTLANTSVGPGPIRQSRSRAASQSGYTSSGSRSRAASGSGYQVLLESRSRAASSASSVYPAYEKDEEGDDEEDQLELEHEIEVGGSGPAQSKLSQFSVVPPRLDQEMKARLDAIFLEYLADVCSNLDATDSKGEMIHQTLMAKKMEKLDQSADFRPFRFRIQAFTTAFAERAQASGLFDSEIPAKKIREYLWSQPYISRFNDDGKKAKSKGNHIWTIEAKKLPDRKWIFREFVRCIKGPAPSVGFVGLTWQWAPRVWDPQRSSDSIDASFMSPNLPDWLTWEDNVLSGVVPASALGENYEIEAVATFQMGDRVQQLRASTRFFVASPEETEDPAAFAMLSAAGQSEPTCDAPRETLESMPVPSREGSPLTSPPTAQASLYRSPSIGSSSAFESASQSHSRLLPQFGSAGSSYAGSGLGTPGSALEASFAQLDPRQLHEREQQRFLAQLQQAGTHGSSGSDSAGAGGASGEVPMQMQDEQSFAAAQAALHQHYSTAAMQQGLSYSGIPAEQLSFAPPPELVQNALQDAIPVDSYASLDSTMLAPSMTGGEDPFQLHVMGQQPPFATTIDPSTL